MKKSKLIATLAATAVLSIGGAIALSGCTPAHEHTYEDDWTRTETHHYYAPTCEHKEDETAYKDYGEHVYDNAADADCNTCGYQRTVTLLTGVITAPGPNGGYKLANAQVSIGGQTVTTNENGEYTVAGLTAGTGVEIRITHPACQDFVGTVDIAVGGNTKNQQLAVRPIAELGKSYFQLMQMETSNKTDFTHVQNSAMWETSGNVQVNHGEGLCLHIDNNETKDDMTSVIYQKIAVTSANSKMMFRVRGFGQDKPGLFAVRVIDIEGYSKADVKASNDEVWQTMDSQSYFISYEYDLSAYEGKTVVVMIGAKQGQHNAIERIRFVGKTESWLLPFITAADLKKLTATDATDLDGADAVKNAIGDASWLKVGDQGGANEGWLFKDGTAAEEGSTDLCVFTYKKLNFNGTKTISVRARAFSGDMNVPNHGRVEPQIVIKIFDADGNPVEIGGNGYTIATESYETAYFSLGETLTGEYTFAVGFARGHRLAVDQIKFIGDEMQQGEVTGTVKCGTAPVGGVKVNCGPFKTVTEADGTFTLPVEIFPGKSLSVSFEKDGYVYDGEALTVSADDLAQGSKALGEIKLDKVIIGDITMSKIEALTAGPAEDLDKNKINDSSWIKVGREGNHTANEGWLFRCDDRYAEEGSTDINGYVYKKLTFAGVNTIAVRARTFGGQNSVSGHGQVYPEIVIAVIDSEGNLLEIGNNCYSIATESYETAYMTLPQALTGEYTFVIGIARGRVLAVDSVQFKTETMVKGSVTGTVTDGENAIAGATVSYAHTSVTTGADGTFTLPAEIFPGESITVKVEKDGYTYAGAAITVAAADLAGGSKALGEIALDKEIIKGLTLPMIKGLTASAPENIIAENNREAARNAFASWGKVGDQGEANEGWLLKDAGDAAEGSTDLKVYAYKKLTLTGVKKITVSARTFNGQNSSMPQIVIAVIDSEGNLVEIGGNCHTLEGENWGTGEFVLPANLDGDYTVAIGFARGQRLAIGNVNFVTEN